jgi:hypothetical protein
MMNEPFERVSIALGVGPPTDSSGAVASQETQADIDQAADVYSADRLSSRVWYSSGQYKFSGELYTVSPWDSERLAGVCLSDSESAMFQFVTGVYGYNIQLSGVSPDCDSMMVSAISNSWFPYTYTRNVATAGSLRAIAAAMAHVDSD